MKLIVGLGNPGSQYEKTRHNAGFMAIDRLIARHVPAGTVPKARFHAVVFEASVRSSRCLFIKPTTYMNLSGRSVQEALAFYRCDPASDLLVLVDDVALPTGAVRIRASGSPGGHNGLASIQQSLGSEIYPRLRIGVDAKPPVMTLEDYVLGRFTPEQTALLGPALERAADATEAFITDGVTKAMNTFNTPTTSTTTNPKPDSDSPKK